MIMLIRIIRVPSFFWWLLLALVFINTSEKTVFGQDNDETVDYDQGWLRYQKLPFDDDTTIERFQNRWSSLCVSQSLQDSAILDSAQNEWFRGLLGMLGMRPEHVRLYYSEACRRKGGEHGLILELKPQEPYSGYHIKTNIACDDQQDDANPTMDTCTYKTIIHAKDEVGLLWGVFGLLRNMQTQPYHNLNLTWTLVEEPKSALRLWNAWDNVDGTVERGYAGGSLFQWHELPKISNQRYQDYARLLSSVGCNGIALPNVDACQHQNEGLLNATMLSKMAGLAKVFGDWGISLYLVPCFASPMLVGILDTADPMDHEVQSWWTHALGELSSRIPTFRGLLLQADSKHEPGPATYGRNQSVGANMLAKALQPINGTVIWRGFEYSTENTKKDRAVQAYETFVTDDGEFEHNVVLQIKNGPLDFQVREPPSPLFTAMKKTNVMLELQVTQEYLGQGKALTALASQWEYYLSGFPLSSDSKLQDLVFGGVSGVGNFGNSSSWAGVMSMANAYSWGRMAWDPYLTAEQVLDEWIMLTFGWDETVRFELLNMMLMSWEVFENYTCPLGMGLCVSHLDHYLADPNSRNDDYLHADSSGIGYDRTVASGSGFIGHYDENVAKLLEDTRTCPEEVLLFMHHVPWRHRLRSHNNLALVEYLYKSHAQGVRSVVNFVERFQDLKPPLIDQDRHGEILNMLQGQVTDAQAFCTKMVDFFSKKSGIPPTKSTKSLCDPYLELEEEEILIKEEERKAAGIGFGLGVFLAIAGMIFTAYQMQEYPDGIYASICRVAVVIGGHVVRFLTVPCRAMCGKPYQRTGHMPIGQNDYQEPYNGHNGHYT